MTAPQQGNRSEQPQRTRGSNPQRIFLASGKIVDRPPVLFRVPSVGQVASETESELTEVPLDSAGARSQSKDAAPPSQGTAAPKPLEKSVQTKAPASASASTEFVGESAGSQSNSSGSGHARGPAAPHFTTKRSVEIVPASEPVTQRVDIPENKLEQVAVAPPTSPVASEPAVAPKNDWRETISSDTNRDATATRSNNRDESKSRATEIPPVAPVPAGRSWMESYGSRLIPVLLIAAVAAYALLVNQDNTPAPEHTLADIEVNESEAVDIDAVTAPLRPAVPMAAESTPAAHNDGYPREESTAERSTSAEAQTAKESSASGPSLSGPSLFPPARTKPSIHEPKSQAGAEVAQVPPATDIEQDPAPAFDGPLSGLETARMAALPTGDQPMIAAPATTREQRPTTNIQQPITEPSWTSDLAAVGAAMGVDTKPTNTVPSGTSTVTSEGTSRDSAGSGSGPVRRNQWANEVADTNATITEPAAMQPSGAKPATKPMDARAAIEAVVDAAVAGQYEPAMPTYESYPQPSQDNIAGIGTQTGGASNLMTTATPSGVDDWSRYLPPPAATFPINSPANMPTVPGVYPADAYQPGLNQPGYYPSQSTGQGGYPVEANEPYGAVYPEQGMDGAYPGLNGPLTPSGSLNAPVGGTTQPGYTTAGPYPQFYGPTYDAAINRTNPQGAR